MNKIEKLEAIRRNESGNPTVIPLTNAEKKINEIISYLNEQAESKVHYMQTGTSHCFICHQDWEGDWHQCSGTRTGCHTGCSKRYTEVKPNYCSNCGHKLD